MEKMKLHKMRGVALETCAAEQKIAYNIAFRADISYSEKYKALASAAEKVAAVADMVAGGLRQYRAGYDYKPGKYNEDAIFAALNAGLRQYMEKPFIAADYAEIGRAFPVAY